MVAEAAAKQTKMPDDLLHGLLPEMHSTVRKGQNKLKGKGVCVN